MLSWLDIAKWCNSGILIVMFLTNLGSCYWTQHFTSGCTHNFTKSNHNTVTKTEIILKNSKEHHPSGFAASGVVLKLWPGAFSRTRNDPGDQNEDFKWSADGRVNCYFVLEKEVKLKVCQTFSVWHHNLVHVWRFIALLPWLQYTSNY